MLLLVGHKDIATRFELAKSKLKHCCGQVLLPQSRAGAKSIKGSVESPHRGGVVDEVLCWVDKHLAVERCVEEGTNNVNSSYLPFVDDSIDK